jgi:hypothetical protein
LCWPLDAYADYLSRKLDRHFTNPALTPLARLQAFVDDACQGVERYDFSRGCLVGNLGQEVGCLDAAIQQGWKTSSCAGRGNWRPACSSLPTTGLSAATRIVRRLPMPSGSAGRRHPARPADALDSADACLFPVVSQGPRLIVSPIYSHSVYLFTEVFMFQGILISKDDAAYRATVQAIGEEVLPDGDVTVRVGWSTLNYKDGLAITGRAPWCAASR